LKKFIKAKIEKSGLRLTYQRIKIAEILFAGPPKHFTAEHIKLEVKEKRLNISLATIYNTLRDFNGKSLIRQIKLESTRNWYDTCLEDHHHFYNSKTQQLIDIKKNDISLKKYPSPPIGYKIKKYDVLIEIE
jgi:Fur family iron response transcriptional regulator